MNDVELRAYAARLAADAPPLTAETVTKLRGLFLPAMNQHRTPEKAGIEPAA